MPELPEVETVVQSLKLQLIGRKIINFEPLWSKVVDASLLEVFNFSVEGQIIRDISRRGKFVLLQLNNVIVAIHLRMTGTLFFTDKPVSDYKHITALFRFSAKEKLLFRDLRKFGRIYLYSDFQELDHKLGIEPLGTEFTAEWLWSNLPHRQRQLKALLLDQSFIAGLGNIYVDEVLWQAKLHPLTHSNKVTTAKTKALYTAIVSILTDAIMAKGTTIQNFTFEGERTGQFRDKLQVFRNEDTPCPRCKTTIRKIRVAGRGTYICPRCQRR